MSFHIIGQTAGTEFNDQKELEIILKKCAEYCTKLSNSVLDFECEEKITEEINTISDRRGKVFAKSPELDASVEGRSSKQELYSYVYDYKFMYKDNGVTERRTLLKENGKKKNELDAQLKTKRFRYQSIVLSPIEILDKSWQPFYDYKIIQKKKFKGDRVVVLEATPNEKMTTNNPYGILWIKEDDFSIVKIEWDQESLQNLDFFVEDAMRFSSWPEIKISAEYTFEKNGIRFPSKYSVIETYYRGHGVNFIRSRMFVTLKKYKFFTVE